jgi:monoamine oxidase
MQDSFDVVVIGAGAAGLGAAARLAGAALSFVVLEARSRIGGRAHTLNASGLSLDLGCGWLHSAKTNVLAPRIDAAGFAIDRTPPHWERQAWNQDFSPDEQRAFRQAYAAFQAELKAAARDGREGPASSLMEPGGRWNPLMDAISSYYNGAEYDQVSIQDYAAYEDGGVNWRVRAGYGAALAALGARAAVFLDCEARRIDHAGRALRLETGKGLLTARAVIVTIPTPAIAQGRLAFAPDLPDHRAAAAALPLGLADKAFLRLAKPEAFPAEGHLFGRIDRAETGSYHLRPFGRPYVEAYLGGRFARQLEGEGPGAMAAFAVEELVGLLGSDIRAALTPIAETAWAFDPFALGAYSHACPGSADARARLAQPAEGRIFFAGEATSPHAFSTAHGAWETGVRAAEEAIGALAGMVG